MRAHVLALLAGVALGAPFWRNDTANIAYTAALNTYLHHHNFSDIHDGAVTDEQPVQLEWSVLGDMPEALKDGVACWTAPNAQYPEGEVVLAGGLWPVGVAHVSGHNRLNFSFSFDIARRAWLPLPLPPYSPGRTQGACLDDGSLVIISGGDGGTVGPRVMRLFKGVGTSAEWTWDVTSIPALPASASRITAAAHAVDGRWLVIGLGSSHLTTTSPPALPYRLDLSAAPSARRWEALPPHPLSVALGVEISVPISATAGGKWLVFGGGYAHPAGSAAATAWADIPADLATLAVFGPRPTGSTMDVRDAFAYDFASNAWETLPRMPLNMVQGPKLAPVVGGRYVLLLGAQRRLTARRGEEPPDYMAAVHRPPIDHQIQYYGDDAVFYDTERRVYGSLGKLPYGVVTASWVSNGTHVLGFGGEPCHGWNGNTETVIQMARITLS